MKSFRKDTDDTAADASRQEQQAKKDRATFAHTIAIVGGAVLWIVTAAISRRVEAWDSPLYWMSAYPLSIALAGWLGSQVPEKPWRWGLGVMLAQAGVLAVSSGSFGLLPLGLIVFSVLAVPAIIAAKLMAKMRLRRGKS